MFFSLFCTSDQASNVAVSKVTTGSPVTECGALQESCLALGGVGATLTGDVTLVLGGTGILRDGRTTVHEGGVGGEGGDVKVCHVHIPYLMVTFYMVKRGVSTKNAAKYYFFFKLL